MNKFHPQDLKNNSLAFLAARVTVYLIAFLALLKITAGIKFGSIAIVSEGIHTTVDLAAGIVSFITLRAAFKPPDKDHPYGHGKWENLMGLIQAGFIMAPSGYIIYRAVHHVFFHRDQLFGENLEGLDISIWVMIITVIINIGLGLWLRRVWKITGSEAIRANSYHQFADLYTSLGVIGALILVRITGKVIFDPLIAIVVGCYAIYLGWQLMAASADSLLDKDAGADIETRIQDIISEMEPEIRDYHRLRTRKGGQTIFGDMHITFCRNTTIEQAHALMDKMEEGIEKRIGNMDITAHAEPCEQECEGCVRADRRSSTGQDEKIILTIMPHETADSGTI